MKTATGLIAWFLRINKVKGITMPWQSIYALPGYEQDTELLRHEMVHIEQIERDGAFVWTVKVFWYLLRYGYKSDRNPYESEARNHAAR